MFSLFSKVITEILFYIILEKKQPIYINEVINETIENILNNTNISINDLENFLNIQFKDGISYIYSLKQLSENNNPYACFELGLKEYENPLKKRRNEHALKSISGRKPALPKMVKRGWKRNNDNE